MNSSDILSKAADLMQKSRHYRGRDDIDGRTPAYCPILAMGVVCRQLNWNGYDHAIGALYNHIREPIPSWNDANEKSEVIRTMREVAEKLRRKGQ